MNESAIPSYAGSDEIATGDPTRLLHVCLEDTRRDSAAGIHSAAIAGGLAKRGLAVERSWYESSRVPKAMGWARLWINRHRLIRQSDAVYARWHPLDFPTYLSARMFRKPLILEVNGQLEDVTVSRPRISAILPLLRVLTRAEFAAANEVITVSPGLKKWVETLAPQHTVTSLAPNGVDIPVDICAKSASRPRYAVFVGALAPWQNVQLILDAAQSEDWPMDLEFRVIGDGRESGVVQEAAESSPRITYRGRLSRERTLQELSGASLSFCVPSPSMARNHINGVPFKLAESLVMGVPVVVSNLPHQTSLVERLHGGMTVAEVASEVCQAAKVLLSEFAGVNERKQLADRARRSLSWDSAVSVAEDAIRRALAQ